MEAEVTGGGALFSPASSLQSPLPNPVLHTEP